MSTEPELKSKPKPILAPAPTPSSKMILIDVRLETTIQLLHSQRQEEVAWPQLPS